MVTKLEEINQRRAELNAELYANRTWSTVAYDESIIEPLEQELTKDICQLAKDLVREHRASNNAGIAESVTIIAETIKPAIKKNSG